uniref:Uncharacterized protein n=1 Tax=Anolis carolinensis TaxID=28377 RepID=G1KF22_ANOCA
GTKAPRLVLLFLLAIVARNNAIILDKCDLTAILWNVGLEGFEGTTIADCKCLSFVLFLSLQQKFSWIVSFFLINNSYYLNHTLQLLGHTSPTFHLPTAGRYLAKWVAGADNFRISLGSGSMG